MTPHNIPVSKYADIAMTCLLTPLSWIYGAVVFIRNKLFDKNLISQVEFSVPVVSIGNITVGGTGKTPHVEYLVNNLASEYNIGIVSRGYKRSTRGYVLANSLSTPSTIGDEPYQLYRKFGMCAKIAVCEKRVEGIKQLLEEYPEINLIILDDAYQHRYIKPKVSIMLTDYNRPVYHDKLLPLGRLRESVRGVNRADIVLITKCPGNLQPIDYRLILHDLDLKSFQQSFFTRFSYSPLKPVFSDDEPYHVSLESLTENDSVLLLTGIANPRQFVRHFKPYPFKVKVSHFPDHHSFTRKDVEEIAKKFEKMTGRHKIIVTTEKDAVRLASNPYFPMYLKKFVYFQPIEVKVLEGIKGSHLTKAVREAIEEKENPLNVKYDS